MPAANRGLEPDEVARSGRRTRVVRLLVAVAMVLIALALVFGFVGLSRQSAASDARKAADDLNDERRDLERRAEGAKECQREYRRLAEEIGRAGYARIDAASAFNVAAQAVIDAGNAAVDQTNAGNVAGARTMYENEMGAAIAAAEDDLARVQQTLSELETSVEGLQGDVC